MLKNYMIYYWVSIIIIIIILQMKKKRMDKNYDPKKLYIKGQRFIKSKKENKENSKLQPEE